MKNKRESEEKKLKYGNKRNREINVPCLIQKNFAVIFS